MKMRLVMIALLLLVGVASYHSADACPPGFQDVNSTACRTTAATLQSGEDQPNSLMMTSGGKVRVTIVATGMVVAGDGTMASAMAVSVGAKTFQGIITGTGAITQTQKLYGAFSTPITLTNGKLLCTLTLSGTAEASDVCATVTDNYPYFAVLTATTTGTSATGVMRVGN